MEIVEDGIVMINSKALKGDFTKYSCGCAVDDEKRGFFRNLLHKCVHKFFLFVVYYPIESFFTRLVERIGRSVSWARFTYLNYDFDSAFLYSVMSFKLNKLHKCLENGHAVQQTEDMEALKELIAICDRLFSGNYDDKYLDQHDDKWGKLPRMKFKPLKDEKGKVKHYKLLPSTRKKVKTKKHKAQERIEFRRCFELAEQDRKSDIDRMAEILKSHATHWWD
jgi:hypothetical protein